MAQISLSISTQDDSIIEVNPLSKEGDCLSIHIETRIAGYNGARPHIFCKDWITIHGTVADIRTLCVRMLAALPAQVDRVADESEGSAPTDDDVPF